MARTIIVIGYGPGVSNAVAERFGLEGFAVALVGRNPERLTAGVERLSSIGVTAVACPADASDPAAVVAAIAKARAALGPIGALQWNAYSRGGGDLIAATPDDIRGVLDVALVGLVAAVQATFTDLKAAGDGAVLITNGAFGDLGPASDALAVKLSAMGLAVANAAKHKLVGLLAERLQGEGVYVGEVTIAGLVKGTTFDQGGPAIDPARIAGEFWRLYSTRDGHYARVS